MSKIYSNILEKVGHTPLVRINRLNQGGATVLAVDEEDQLLLLITCTGDDTERLVVAARRLRDGEREDSLHFRAN